MVAVVSAVVLLNCKPAKSQGVNTSAPPSTPVHSVTPDAGIHDAGVNHPDAGVDGGTAPDAGGGLALKLTEQEVDSAAGWTFLGHDAGVPSEVFGITADEGGNLWVAGGEEGLFLLRPGAARFERFTMADGLRPYGYLPDGGAPEGEKYLKVLSVAGGPAGTVFVGYSGKPPQDGQRDCESNAYRPAEEGGGDLSIYKSGDADKVTLTADGLQVVHYDIFSGPNVVATEQHGREKLCNILRIAYDPKTKSVWFGGNHGFAWGDATFEGAPGCNGQNDCAGVLEHVHPAICAKVGDGEVVLTDAYYGVAVDPHSGDVWVGGANRATRFRYGSLEQDWFKAQFETEWGDEPWSRIDVWPDLVSEPVCPTEAERRDDAISSMAAMPDGTAWVGSFTWGLARLDAQGQVLGYVDEALITPHVAALATDTLDGSLWVGHRWGGGISRIKDGVVLQYAASALGAEHVLRPVEDIQVDRSNAVRRILVAFGSHPQGDGGTTGLIGIYEGE